LQRRDRNCSFFPVRLSIEFNHVSKYGLNVITTSLSADCGIQHKLVFPKKEFFSFRLSLSPSNWLPVASLAYRMIHLGVGVGQGDHGGKKKSQPINLNFPQRLAPPAMGKLKIFFATEITEHSEGITFKICNQCLVFVCALGAYP
jgi:hypothetical protein